MSLLDIFFGVLLLVVTLVLSGLAIATCIQVFRLRNKRLCWRAGTLAGFPLFATIFLLVSMVLLGVMCKFSGGWKITASVLYLLISFSWFIASYFSSKRYITDHGIVKNVNDPSQTVAWHQIYDFFERSSGNHCSYIFIYQKNNHRHPKKMVRIQLKIPDKKNDEFKNLISHKLGHRLKCFEEDAFDISELNDF
ncbi:MAG TPA: hypothetical protein VE868_01340 [Balneolaceae bacterium]|nr:hypothetical protein [Balneolaceae bacterium]